MGKTRQSPIVTVHCTHCDKPKEITESLASKSERHFCNNKCFRKHIARDKLPDGVIAQCMICNADMKKEDMYLECFNKAESRCRSCRDKARVKEREDRKARQRAFVEKFNKSKYGLKI